MIIEEDMTYEEVAKARKVPLSTLGHHMKERLPGISKIASEEVKLVVKSHDFRKGNYGKRYFTAPRTESEKRMNMLLNQIEKSGFTKSQVIKALEEIKSGKNE